LVGQGVEDRDEGIPYGEEYFLEDMDGIRIPDPPTRLESGRLTIRNFSAVVRLVTDDSSYSFLGQQFQSQLAVDSAAAA
jgi:hypothetical protein